ncbi:MAG TPA: efflux RND transporter periplasmic adaptor subunit [Candidatus Binataceae bacterium]|nr:efflux RND transporter periplasmic adaptor subunit [Candidatus Binataceae bacterium]
MRRLLRRLLSLTLLIALVYGGYYLGNRYVWPTPDTTTIQTVGIIEAPEVNVTSRIAGRIFQLGPLEGDHVERDQILCRIEDVDIRNQLAQAQGNLANAEGDLHDAERTMARYRKLYDEHVISAKDRDDAITHIERARGAVVAAQASVRFYTDQLADTVIRSPITGIVVSKNLQVGEWVTPGTAILTIDDLSTIWARVDVEETDLTSIKIGGAARITMPGKPPQVYNGRVMAIGQEGQFATETDVRRGRQDLRTFYIKVRVIEPNGDLKPGMTAEVSFSRINNSAPVGQPEEQPPSKGG